MIVGVNRARATTQAQLELVLAGLRPGQAVPVKILRPNGSPTAVKLALGTLPATPLTGHRQGCWRGPGR